MRPPPRALPIGVARSLVLRLAVILAIGVMSVPARAADLPYTETFSGANGVPWPAPWFPATGLVTTWDQQGGRGRLNGTPANVSRMILPGYSGVDVEVEVTFEFANVAGQGIGFYVRQNGGSLQAYLPHGQGYAMFLKGNWAWPEDLGLWREIDGVETQFAHAYNPILAGLQNGVRYRLRYRVTQADPATTLLQARVWTEGDPEPAAWTIEASDTRPELQGTAGSFAADIYNHFGTSPIYLDDLTIRPFPDVTSAPLSISTPSPGLSAPRPHPIAGSASFDLSVPRAGHAELRVFDTAGRLVARPWAGMLGPGTTSLVWRPIDSNGRRLSPGLYCAVLEAGGERATRRIVVTR